MLDIIQNTKTTEFPKCLGQRRRSCIESWSRNSWTGRYYDDNGQKRQ